MILSKITFKIESWVASAWQADTIWGHLCWGLRYLYDEDELRKFIKSYEDDIPPLLVSDGFPNDLLPCPLVPTPAINTSNTIEAQKDEFDKTKSNKSINLLTKDEFDNFISGKGIDISVKTKLPSTVQLKNQINRLTGTTGGDKSIGTGQLFNFPQYRWETVTVYCKIREDFYETAKELFSYIAVYGYGKRKSVGYGQLSIQNELKEFAGFNTPADANGFVSLSTFVPAANDPIRGYWSVLVKYGKLGEEYATAGNPHKKPLIMFTAGATFYDTSEPEYYGRLVNGLSSFPSVQYGYALPVRIKLPLRKPTEG